MKKNMLKFVILSLSCYLSSAMSVSSALADIAKAFPDISSSSIQMIIALPSILIIPFSLLAGAVSNKVSKRLLVLVGMILLTLGGIGPAFANSFLFIMILRCVFGSGVGLITPFATGLIADFFDGDERAEMIGMQTATNSFASSVLSFAAGLLCTINWHYSFIVYILGALIAVLLFFKLPEPAKVKMVSTEKASPNAPVFLISLLMFLYMLFLFSFYSNIAMMITMDNLGNAMTSGTAITIATLGGLLISLLFGKLYQLFKRFTIVLGIGITAVGFFILYSAYNTLIVYLGAVLIGFGIGIVMPYSMLNVTLKAPKAAISLSIAIVLSAVNVGSFASPFFFKISGQLLGNTTERFTFFVASVCFAASFITYLIMLLIPRETAREAFKNQ